MRRVLTCLLAFAASVLPAPAVAQVAPGPGVRVLKSEVLADDLFFLYSTETLTSGTPRWQRVWLGGWSQPSDVPRDRIFVGLMRDGVLLPRKVEVLALPGALVNDPAITRVPGSLDLRMYFTALSLQDLDHATERNTIWTARSTDGGRTWRELRQAIAQDNGVNACGAWSPSVLVEDRLMCVYYHGNSPCLGVYRTCFERDGETVARPTAQLDLPFGLANVDVSRRGTGDVMVGAALGLADFVEIRAVESDDGHTWRPLSATDDGLLVRADTGVVFTPHIDWLGDAALVLSFTTRSSLDVLLEDDVLHRWTIQLPAE